MVDQARRRLPVPEAERLRLVDALRVQVVRDLEDGLGAVAAGAPAQRASSTGRRTARRARAAREGSVRALGETAQLSDGLVAALAARRRSASASSAQTITVGPEPERVAPTAPGGRSARISSRSGDGRYGWCSRSSNAAASRSARPAGDPGAEQRGPRDVEGGVGVRDLGRQREARLGGRSPSLRGPPRPALSGSESAIRAIRPSQVSVTPPPRQAARLSEWPSSGPPRASRSSSSSSCPVHFAAATIPSAIVAALEPSPRARGMRSVHSNDSPSGEATRPNARMPMCAGSGGASEPSVTSTSFQRSSATAAESNPGPRFADVAGART